MSVEAWGGREPAQDPVPIFWIRDSIDQHDAGVNHANLTKNRTLMRQSFIAEDQNHHFKDVLVHFEQRVVQQVIC